ncbi:fimbria/pilus outer membrane usher protein [Pseudomonas sp. FP2196]|uniref:fimbria/pilus outer membrane usher protein n=1 Tax=Pseudomonas sp. FP2196 TaxID=2954086 RepID=UPI0027361B8F|nr:fimbria/pilus outer membrane usher protein [Pseudomonas sp. FP2196]WLH35475.1 fimbria/pilus outer membrane usher protein [Pseudomonas sp. FP2196]
MAGGFYQWICLAALGICAQAASAVQPQVVEFDTDVLGSRGVDPAMADYFRYAPRFREGTRVVALFVNERQAGWAEARFDAAGNLCFTKTLLDKAGLRSLDADRELPTASNEGCLAFLAHYPQTRVTLRPNQEEVRLVVPTQALAEIQTVKADFTRAGTAGMFSYDLLGLDSSGTGNSGYVSASTVAGFNAHDWIVRSRQQLTSGQQQGWGVEHLYSYAQRDLHEVNSTIQLGQINTLNPLFAGVPITGLQLFPVQSNVRPDDPGAVVEGIANSQSRVEVRQSGALVYTTVIPPGPYRLSGIVLLNGSDDLQVRVIGEEGSQREFSVPVSAFHQVTQSRPGFHWAAGKVRSRADEQIDSQAVTSLTGSWGVGPSLMLSSGVMATADYQSVGWGIDTRLFQHADLRWRSVLAWHDDTGSQGTQQNISLSSAFFERASFGVSTTLRSRAYRDLLDTQAYTGDQLQQRFSSQYSATLGWSEPHWGGFTVAYSRSALHNGDHRERLSGSWGKGFRHASVSFNIETEPGASRNRGGATTAMYLSVGIALGGSRQLRTYARRREDATSLGAALSEQVNDAVSYRLGMEGIGDDPGARYSANVGLVPRYTQVNLGVSQDAASSSYMGQLKGGIAMHEGGVTFSPYAIQDTFGIATVGDLSGVQLSTPAGPAWTDGDGQAVISGLTAYSPNRVEVVTRTLPRRADLINGYKELHAGRGSFNTLNFDVISVRRVLLQIVDKRGQPISRGASVMTAEGQLLGSVVEGGKAFLSDVQPDQVVQINLADNRRCELQLALSPHNDSEQLFETVEGVCHAS